MDVMGNVVFNRMTAEVGLENIRVFGNQGCKWVVLVL